MEDFHDFHDFYSDRHDTATPLFLAVLKNNREVVRTLLDAGADPDLASENLVGSLLDKARRNGNTEMAQILEDAGVEVSSDANAKEYYI